VIDGADQVHLDGLADQLVADHPEQRVPQDARAVHEHVEALEALEDGLIDGAYLLAIRGIGHESEALDAVTRGELRGPLLDLRRVRATIDDDVRARGGEPLRDRPADSTRRSRDQRDFSGETPVQRHAAEGAQTRSLTQPVSRKTASSVGEPQHASRRLDLAPLSAHTQPNLCCKIA
jgi:hypothetical protein